MRLGAILEYPATYLHIPEPASYRTRDMKTKGSILIQRDTNKWPGILESSLRLIGAVFFGEYMLVHRKDDLKLCLSFRSVPFSKKLFVWKVDFVKVGPLLILKKKDFR